jgi:uroporphyrinogen-III synthase
MARVQLVCRGPKPVGALKAIGLKPFFVVPEPNTWRDIVTAFDAEQFGKNKRVWVQEYGRSNDELAQALLQRSSFLGKVALYAWKLPDDLEPLKATLAAMIAGSVAVAAFTAGVQVDHLFEVARRLSLSPALLQAMNERIVIASIGPMTTERLTAHSISVDIEPAHPKLGHLVQAVAARAPDSLRQKRRQGFAASHG